MWWFHIFIYLKLIDIITLLLASKSLNEVANGYKQFKDHRNLFRKVIDTTELNRCFMKHFDELIIRLFGQFTFNTTLCLRYSLESLKRQFCISYVLSHLFFCNRYPSSNEGNCRLCSRLFVNDASDFVSLIRYHFTLIFQNNNAFNKDLELFFAKANLGHFTLDLLYQSEMHYTLAD